MALLVSLALLPAANAQASRPNIVFILADDMGYGEVSTYPANSPHGRLSTPHLASLASQGIVFSSAYAGVAVCAPSRCSLMTGKHTGHTTIRGNKRVEGHDMPLAPNDVTIAQVLQARSN